MLISYFSVLNFVLALLGLFAIYLYWIVRSDERRSRHVLFNKLKIAKLHKGLGIITAICGGILASQTLMLAKSGVKLIVLSFQITNQFTDGLSFFIFAFLVATAVLQVNSRRIHLNNHLIDLLHQFGLENGAFSAHCSHLFWNLHCSGALQLDHLPQPDGFVSAMGAVLYCAWVPGVDVWS